MGKHQMYDIFKELQQPGEDHGLAPASAFPLTKPKTTQCSCLGISETSAEQKDHAVPFIQQC